MLSKTEFLLKSSNAHGVHSPFVFNIVQNALYAKHFRLSKGEYKALPQGWSYQKTDILYRLIRHFKATKLLALGENATAVTDTLRQLGENSRLQLWFFSTLAPIQGGIEIGIVSDTTKTGALKAFEEIIKNSNNNTMCVIDNIHTSQQMEWAWEAIKKTRVLLSRSTRTTWALFSSGENL
ncbi:hypothetical protein LRS05_13050 [Flavobacterium sp. J372]|uniref:hypothetical protein n=1 Tax=Flavobacterium sp. J372 TaxID=2898436 RepID=UPI0021514627|nr:hypothetical protein [Flavobacterium sp. J372]MCR5863001.1 hypothetical protein [Flavobacterium sp. J372]